MNHYEVLGINRLATAESIKVAYRAQSRKYHPDVNSDPKAEERFKAIGLAYEVLSDPVKREVYDLHSSTGIPTDTHRESESSNMEASLDDLLRSVEDFLLNFERQTTDQSRRSLWKIIFLIKRSPASTQRRKIEAEQRRAYRKKDAEDRRAYREKDAEDQRAYRERHTRSHRTVRLRRKAFSVKVGT
jgi:curved DNA-binding protein CbpA